MKNYFPFILIIIIACSSGTEEKTVANEEVAQPGIIGEWRNLSLIVRMPDSTVSVREGQWEAVLGIKPIRTTFNENGTFISEYRTLEDSVFMTSNGSWEIEGDTLSMVERGTENKYFYAIDNDTVTFRGYLDWDQDGLANDHYAGKQFRYNTKNSN